MKHDIILFLIQFFQLKMVKKFLLEMLLQDFLKKLKKQSQVYTQVGLLRSARRKTSSF